MRILIPGGSASLPSNDETEEFPVTVEAPETESVTGPSGAPGPDPATGEWETWLRRRIPGRTRPEQHTAVAGWWQAALADQPRLDAIGLGTRRPSTVEQIIGGTPADEAWDDRLAEAIDAFPGCRFATQFLVPQARRRRAAETRKV